MIKWQLNDLLTGTGKVEILGVGERSVAQIAFDSRAAGKESLFIAVKGTTSDGHAFISQAIQNGATSIVCEVLPETRYEQITYVKVADSSNALGIIASNYYDHPSSKLSLIGVTGTNGKTTIVTLLYQLFRSAGIGAGLISTIENKINERIFPATHTTPDPVQLNALMARMVEEGCSYCFMEVSSHAIDQQRIAGLAFRGGIFTNITHDHLDYHKTFDAYIKAKKKFFNLLPSDAFALVNKDDKNGLVMTQNSRAKVLTYSLRSMADFKCKIVENLFHGLELEIDGNHCWFKLVGSFNAYNILATYATALQLGLEKTTTLALLSIIEPVNGRFNTIVSKEKITVIIDYAHTPDALQNVLETINLIRSPEDQLITILGAGGNRDITKRPVMARIACDLSDRVILTSDNPRFEDPDTIIENMKSGLADEDLKKVLIIVNRAEAIKTGCTLAKPGNIILVAGKGHETYQEIKGTRHHFDDKEVVKKALAIE